MRNVYIALAFALVCAWLAALGGPSLISSDEGRYASLSLAMLQSGDWVTPRLNGLLYFEKPPLQYWAGALSMAVFGVSEFAARLWPGLSGLATVALVAFTAQRLWGAVEGYCALCIAGSTTWIVLNSHFLTLDAGLCAALTLVLCALLLAERPGLRPSVRRRWVLVAWAAMGLAVLSKGLVGVVIPGMSLAIASLWQRDLTLWRRLHWTAGLAVLLAITVPWFAVVSIRNPEFARFFFIHEHFERFLTATHHREGAWWYFIPYVLIGFMPWTSALPWLGRHRQPDRASTLLWSWAAFTFVFFSVSESKLPSYILPMFPAVSLLLARRLPEVSARALRLHLLSPSILWVAVLLVATQSRRFVSAQTPQAAVSALAEGLVVAAVLSLIALFGAAQLLRRNRIAAALALVASAHLVATLLVLQSHDRYGQLKSSDKIAEVLERVIEPDTPVFSVGAYDQTLPFYLRRPVTLVAYRDEFALGEDLEPARWIPTIDAFAAHWTNVPRAAAYMTSETLERLRTMGLQMHVVFRDPRRVVVVKP
ncbi:MAG: glycosyltransferase family 39 protein [Caldimonas sp.]